MANVIESTLGCFKPACFLEWQSTIDFFEIEANVNLMVHFKEKFDAPKNYILK